MAETVLAEEPKGPVQAQLGAADLGTWAGLSNTDLGLIFFSKLVDFGLWCFSVDDDACDFSAVLPNFQI